jgi:TPR repeat protein
MQMEPKYILSLRATGAKLDPSGRSGLAPTRGFMTQVQTSLNDLASRAEGGDPGAQYSLGVLFLLGEALEQDLDASYQWLARAACGQHAEAQLLVDKLAPRHFVAVSLEPSTGIRSHASIYDLIVRRLRRHVWFSKQSCSSTMDDNSSRLRGRKLRLKIRFKQDVALSNCPERRL